MALTFPVPLGEFFDELQVQSVAFELIESYAESATRGGRLIRLELGDARWSAQMGLSPMGAGDARRVAAMIRRIGAYNKFHLYNPEAPFPRLDPDGTGLNGTDVRVHAVGGRTLRLTGLPGGYTLSWGDMIAVTYAGGRRQLFEVSDYVEALAGGVTTHFEVTPPPRLGIAIGDPVDLRKAAGRFAFTSRDIGSTDFTERLRSGVTLSAIEDLGAP